MKFNIDGKLFQQQLQAVNKVINSKNAISILDNFLFELENDKLTITGSDQENIVTASLRVNESDGTGSVALPAKTLLEIAKEINNQPVSFTMNDMTGEIDVTFLNGKFRFVGINADEFPRGDQSTEDMQRLEIPAAVLLKGLENTLYAVSQEPIRPVMTGVYWDIHEADITFVATDTHKLVRYINTEVSPGFERGFIMPSKPASILKSIVGKDDFVTILIGEKGAKFEFGDYSLTCRFIKGVYPNYNRVIPDSNPFMATIDRTALLNALRRVAIFSSKASNLVKFEIRQGSIRLAAQDLDYGTSAEETVLCDYEGNDMNIGFNCTFTIEIVNNMKGDTMVLRLSDPARPGLFEPMEQVAGENLVTIQMPMQMIE